MAILPTFLSTLMVTMFDGLVEKLQQMMARQDGVKDIPQKRALEILQAGQRRLSESIREMSSEEQLYYAYMIHSLTKSLVGYQGSLEQLEAAAETRMLLSLLVGIVHSPEEGVSEGRIGSDVVLAVVPAFSSMVHEGGVVLLQSLTVLEAFQEFDAGFDFFAQLKDLVGSKGWSRAFADKHEEMKVEKVNCEDEETETEKVEKVECSEEAPVESGTSSIESAVNNEIVQFIEGRTFLGAVFNDSEAKNDEDGNKNNNKGEPVDHGMSVVYRDVAVNFSEVSQLHRQLTVSHYATEATGDESSTAMNVDALPMASHELEDRNVIQATVPKEDEDRYMEFQKEMFSIVSRRVRKLKLLRREYRDGYKSVAHLEIGLSSDVVVESTTGPSDSRTRKVTIEDDRLWASSDYFAELKRWTESTRSEHLMHSGSNRLPPPQPPPSTSWCWKRRLESVTDPQQYVCTATPATLEELDSECQETICHAIASVFGAHTAVTLIHLLHNNVSPTLFTVQDKHGNTPLHCAAIAGNAVIAGELAVLRPSAVSVQNHNCLTPLDIALDHRNDEMVECLLRVSVTSAPHNSSVIQLLESCLVKSLKKGYTHFLQLVLQLRTEHGLAIDFECTDTSGHTAWQYLKQAAPAVRAVVAELLQESDLQQPLLGRLLKSLNTDTCQQSPLEISIDPAAIVHRDTTAPIPKQRLPSTSDSEESDADSIPESSEEDQGNVDSTTAATPLVEQEAPPKDGVDYPTEGVGDEEQSQASIATEADAGPVQVEREESIEHAPDSISNTEGAASLSISQDALETPSELVEQKNRVTATTSTTLGECDTQAHSEQTVSQPIEQASPPSDSPGGGVEPKQPLHTPLYSQEPQNDSSTGEGTSDKEETDGDREEKVDELAKDVNTAAGTEGDKEREQFQVEPPLPAPKPLAAGEPSLELALAEIRRQLKEEQDSAGAKLRGLVAKKLIAEMEKLKQAYSELITEVEENRNSDDEHSQAISLSSTHSRPTSLSSNKSTHSLPTLLSNSESTHSNSESTTDSSVHLPSTDTAHTEANLVLSDCTSAKDNRPLRYSQPYTDSVTSSPNDSSSPQKPSVQKSRRKQRRTTEERVSLYRPSTTSGSDNRESSKRLSQRSRDSRRARVKRSSYSECDTNSSRFSRYRPSTTSSLNTREPSTRRPHRSRDSVKARVKSGSFSEYEVSPPLSNDEHSTADTAVSDSLPCESTVDERPTLLPASSSPSHRLAQLKSRKQRSGKKSSQKTKLVTLSTFFRASGEFDKKVFKTWITRTVSRCSYKHLRLVVHQQLFAVFGFSPLKVKLTAKEMIMALAVLDFVKSTKHSIPQEVESNLKTMEKVVKSTRHVNETEDETKSGDGLAKKNEADTHEKQQHYTEESEVDKSTKPSPAEPQMCCTPQNSEKDDLTQLSPSQCRMDSTQTSADEVEPPLPAPKPLAAGEPSLELALTEIRRQLKQEQDRAVAKLREEYESLVAEKEKKLIAEVEKLKQANSELVSVVNEFKRSRNSNDHHSQPTSLSSTHLRPTTDTSVQLLTNPVADLIAKVDQLKEANSNLAAKVKELESKLLTTNAALSESSNYTSVRLPSTDTAQIGTNVLSDYTSAENHQTRRPQHFSQRDTSDPPLPEKPPVPESRKRQTPSRYRPSFSEISPPLSNDKQHSTADSAVGDSLPCESTVDERPTLPPAPPSQLHRLALLKSRNGRKQRSGKRSSSKNKVVTLAVFFPASGGFGTTGKMVSKSNYNHLGLVVLQQLFTIFGFSSLKITKLSRREREVAKAVIGIVNCERLPVPPSVDNYLQELIEVLHNGSVSPPSKSEHLAPHSHGHVKGQGHDVETLVDSSAKPSVSDTQTWSKPTQEESVGASIHYFANGTSYTDREVFSYESSTVSQQAGDILAADTGTDEGDMKVEQLQPSATQPSKNSIPDGPPEEPISPGTKPLAVGQLSLELTLAAMAEIRRQLKEQDHAVAKLREQLREYYGNLSSEKEKKLIAMVEKSIEEQDSFVAKLREYNIPVAERERKRLKSDLAPRLQETKDEHKEPTTALVVSVSPTNAVPHFFTNTGNLIHCHGKVCAPPQNTKTEVNGITHLPYSTEVELSNGKSKSFSTQIESDGHSSDCVTGRLFTLTIPPPDKLFEPIACVRLHYKYCRMYMEILSSNVAPYISEAPIELFECALPTGEFRKMVIFIDTENYHIDLSNIIQTCLLKKYYLQLVPRQLKVGDPEQPHCISLSECSGEHACVVGNPPFVINGNRLRNLPGAAAEVVFLSRLFQCHPLTLKEASKEAVMNKLERARFAHLATHEYNKGLVLSDVVLTSSDIEQLVFENGPPVLVVLNCCGTAETVCERESIALALLKVKVLAVVAVFGSVEDKLALEFAKLFYHNMIEVGLPATHALYNAQHEVYPPDSTHQYIYLGKDVKITK